MIIIDNTLHEIVHEIDEVFKSSGRDYRSNIISSDSAKRYFYDSYYRIHEMVKLLAPVASGKKILDIGIAYGFYDIVFKKCYNFDVTGADLSENIDLYCHLPRKYDIPVIPYNIFQPGESIPDESFDIVILSEVLEHLRMSPLRVLGELYRILKPNGYLVLTTPNIARLNNIAMLMLGRNIMEPFPDNDEGMNHITDLIMHIREYTMSELSTSMEQAGFRISKKRYLKTQELASWRFCSGMTKKIPRLMRLLLTSVVVPWRSILLITGRKA